MTGLGLYILDEQGEPVVCPDIATWGKWFATANRQLAIDEIGGAVISTVFLGLDHSFSAGPPLLWETLVFGGPLDGEGNRYATSHHALRGHAAILARVITSGAPDRLSSRPLVED